VRQPFFDSGKEHVMIFVIIFVVGALIGALATWGVVVWAAARADENFTAR
jgi:hypothetical protein